MKAYLQIILGCIAMLGTASASAMPVQFYTFEAQFTDEGIALNWSTISETGSMHFVVERSSNGNDWTNLGTLEGQGNSSTYNAYQFIDQQLGELKMYYRICQVDFSGMMHFSNVISVKRHQLYVESIKAYPNPVNNRLMVPFGENEMHARIDVMDSVGKIVHQHEFLSPGTAELDLATLPKGYYFVRIQSGESESIQRIFKN